VSVHMCATCGQCTPNEDLSVEAVAADLPPDVFIQVSSQLIFAAL